MNMASKLVFRIGVSLDDIDRQIVANCEAALAASDRGESVAAKRTLSFENWHTFLRSLTPNRIAILEHVAAHDVVASTRALALALGRVYAAVRADVAELLRIGLLERDGNALRCEIAPDRADLVAA